MKYRGIQEKFITIVITMVGVFFGVYLGSIAGNGELPQLAKIAAVLGVVSICIIMRQRTWLLIPLSAQLGARSFLIPLPFSVNEVMTMVAFGTYLILVSVRVVRKTAKTNLLDILLMINVLYLFTVYLRNPVGMKALNSDLIGGRPYYIILISLFAYYVSSHVTMTAKQARLIPAFAVFCTTLIAVLSLVAMRFPSTSGVLSHIYSGISYQVDNGSGVTQTSGSEDDISTTQRIPALAGWGAVVLTVLCCYYPVLTLFNPLYFIRFLATLAAFTAIGFSGHRSALFGCLTGMLLISYLRSGWSELIKVGVVLAPLLAIVILMNGTLFELPITVQRTLCFLPGHWSHEATENAEASGEWRLDMWKRALQGNRWIKNKVLGDGFGFSRREFQALQRAASEDRHLDAEEGQLLVGGFHSGPISTIRFVGVVGLVLFYVWIIYMAFYTAKLIQRSKGTPFYVYALFGFAGLILNPIFFTFVFGAYDGDLAGSIVSVAGLKILSHALDCHEAKARQEEASASFPVGGIPTQSRELLPSFSHG